MSVWLNWLGGMILPMSDKPRESEAKFLNMSFSFLDGFKTSSFIVAQAFFILKDNRVKRCELGFY